MLGELTNREILGQPQCWNSLLDEPSDAGVFFPPGTIDELLFIGCGSSFHLAQAGASLFAPVIRTRALAASEVFLFPQALGEQGRRIGVVAFSRTGETTEVLRAVETLRTLRGQGRMEPLILGVTCTPGSSLTQACDRAVVLPVTEASLVTTQAYTATFLQLARWASAWFGALDLEPIRQYGEEAMIQASHAADFALRAPLSHFVFLGSGMLFSLAQEGALKMMEMAGMSAVAAFRALEFRHGPKATVRAETLVTMLISATAVDYERSLHQELKALGARTLVLVGDEAAQFPDADFVATIGPTTDVQRAVLYAPTLQRLAYAFALKNQTNPDAPPHLSRSVRI